jgi:4-diphosphocytidyl-2C-methyl-D-erythritol kinase
LKSFLKQRFPAHKGLIDVKNDFSSIVFKHHTDLQEVATALNHQGASYSSLSGSGSTVYGLFAREMEAKQAANRLAHYAFVRAVKTPAPVNQ